MTTEVCIIIYVRWLYLYEFDVRNHLKKLGGETVMESRQETEEREGRGERNLLESKLMKDDHP